MKAGRQTDRHAGRHEGRQADRQADRQKPNNTLTCGRGVEHKNLLEDDKEQKERDVS